MRLRLNLFIFSALVLGACSPSRVPEHERESSEVALNLSKLNEPERTHTCMRLPDQQKFELFFGSSSGHHDYYGFDRCIAQSSPSLISSIKSEIINRGAGDGGVGRDLTHFILVLEIRRRAGMISDKEVADMQLLFLCGQVAPNNENFCKELAGHLLSSSADTEK